jgi:hypothetical protein
MSNKKLNLVRETIRPLINVELADVVGGVRSDCIPNPFPKPRPSPLPRPSLPDPNPPSCLSLGNGLPR